MRGQRRLISEAKLDALERARCQHCGRSDREINDSVQLGARVCLECYERSLAGLADPDPLGNEWRES